jgi:hypothetical protein
LLILLETGKKMASEIPDAKSRGKMSKNSDELIRLSEACKLLSSRIPLRTPVNRVTVWRWLQNGHLAGVRIGRGWYVWRSSVDRVINQILAARVQ